MIAIQFLYPDEPSRDWWVRLVRLFARPGDAVELQCWREEEAACALAGSLLPEESAPSWPYGRIFRGCAEAAALEAILAAPGGEDGPTPFFTATFGGALCSAHWGREIYILEPAQDGAAQAALLAGIPEGHASIGEC